MKDNHNHKYTDDFEEIYLFTRNGKIIDMDHNSHKGLGLCKLYKKKGKIVLEEVVNQEDLVNFATNKDNYWRLPDNFEKLSQMYENKS